MEHKKKEISKLNRKALLALLIFFVETVDTNEPEALQVSFHKYEDGVYLHLTIEACTYTMKDFEKIKPYLNSYSEDYDEDTDIYAYYSLRLTDNADDDITNIITPMFMFGD